MADANETVEATLERANWLFSSGLGGTLGILKEADADLSKRLHGLVKKQGAKDLKFTEAQALAYRQQIRLTQKYMDERLLGHTHAQALKAIGAGTKATVRLMKKLEKQFTGIAKPLQLDSQAMQDSIVRGTGASLLRQHQASVGRYSTAMIQDFERVMRVGALEGLSQHQVISRLVMQGELGGINAAALHAKEPGYFPAPTGYVVRRYWAERIVRTESAYALNAANQATIATAKVTDFPDMQKKILAHFDTRTAPDSIAVHGQIRPVDGLFTDGAGRMYKHPPARPNDREVVIPWRPHWGELPATKQAPPEAQAAAKVEAQPAGLAPASSGQILVPSSSVKAMVAKLKAQHGEQGQDQVLAQKFQQALENAQAAKLKGTEAMGAAKLASEKSLARAQALQQVKAAKTPKSLAELKAKADAYKAEVQAKAAAKVAELEAARAAKLKAAASTKLTALGQAVPSLTDPGSDLVKLIKQTHQTKPELWAEMKKQLGVGGVAPHTVSVAMAKKIAPGADFSAFTKKSKKPEPPPAPKLPPLEFKTVSGYIDIHDATTGAKLAYMKPGQTPGSVMVSPPAHLTGFTAKTFATPEEGAPYALQVSAALQLAKAEQAAAAAKLAAMTSAEKAAAKAAKYADQKKAYADLMAKAAKAPPGPRSFDLGSLTHARPPENNTEPEDYATGLGVSHAELKKAGRKFEASLNSTQRDAIKSFSGSGYRSLRSDEVEGRETVGARALRTAFEIPRPPNDATDGLQVWRGVHTIKRSLVEKWLSAGELDHGGTASSSWGRSTAFSFAGIYENDDGTFGGDGTADAYKVVYRWANKSGRDIETISSHTGEREILQPKKAQFNVRAAYRPPGTSHMVFFELEEK